MTLPDIPEPDTHCFDDDTGKDVWSYSEAQIRAYGLSMMLAERERIVSVFDAVHEKRKHIDNHAAFYARMIRESAP